MTKCCIFFYSQLLYMESVCERWTKVKRWIWESLWRLKQAAVWCHSRGTLWVFRSADIDMWSAQDGDENLIFRRKTIWHGLYFRNLWKRKPDVFVSLGHWVHSHPRMKPYSPNKSLFYISRVVHIYSFINFILFIITDLLKWFIFSTEFRSSLFPISEVVHIFMTTLFTRTHRHTHIYININKKACWFYFRRH